MAYCPELNNREVREGFARMQEALGTPLAYYVYHKNNGNLLDKTPTGENSTLWTRIMESVGNDEIEAIKLKAKLFSKQFSETKQAIEKIPFLHNPNEAWYKEWVRRSATGDTKNYVRYLADSERQARMDRANEMFEEFQDRFNYKREMKGAKEAIKNNDATQYITQLNEERKEILQQLPDNLQDIFTAEKNRVDVMDIKGVARVEAYMLITAAAVNSGRYGRNTTGLLNDLVNIHSEELRMYGVNNQIIDKFIKDFSAAQKEGLTNVHEAQQNLFTSLEDEITQNLVELNNLESYNSFLKNAQDNPSKYNSRAARDNMKLDIFYSVLNNADTFAKSVNPGNFDILKDIAGYIVGKKGESHKSMDLVLPRTNRKMFTRINTGKALIGMFVNHSVNHAITQYTDIAFNSPIRLAGTELSKLNQTHGQEDTELVSPSLRGINNKDLLISRTIGTWIGAAADNVKEPVAGDLNVNQFTVDPLSLLLRLGFSIETALYFLNQPAIIKLTEDFLLAGGESYNYRKILNATVTDFKSKLTKPTDVPDTYDISKKQLADDISGGKDDAFIARQLAILNLFDNLRTKAFDVQKMIRVLRADNLRRQIKTTTNELFKEDARQLFNEPSELTGLESLWDKYPMMKTFYDEAVVKTDEILSQIFPWAAPAFTQTKRVIMSNLPQYQRLTDTQLDYINVEMMNWILSGFELFDGSDREYILKKFPSDFKKAMKEKYPELKDHPLLSALEVEPKRSSKTSVDSIRFLGASGNLTPVERAMISKSWEELINDPKYHKLAVNLIKYTVYSHGFYINPRSFSNLIPVGYFKNLVDQSGKSINDYLESMIESAKNETREYKIFLDQFYRNNSNNVVYVKEHAAQSDNNVPTGVVLEQGVPTQVELLEDRNPDFVTKFSTQTEPARFMDYFTVPYRGKKYLFVRSDGDTYSHKAYYTRVRPLGIFGIAKEYNFNDQNLQSIFSENNPDVIKKTVTKKNVLPTSPKSKVTPYKPVTRGKGQMNMNYEGSKRSDVTATNTFDAIKRGERTASTRYDYQGNISYWSQFKVGDIIEWYSAPKPEIGNKPEFVEVRVTVPLHKLESDTSAEEWSKKEGWSVDYFNKTVKPRIDQGQAYEMEFELAQSNLPTQEEVKEQKKHCKK